MDADVHASITAERDLDAFLQVIEPAAAPAPEDAGAGPASMAELEVTAPPKTIPTDDPSVLAKAGEVSEDEEYEDGEKRQRNFNHGISYLNAVKVQFADRPDVYIHFLNIMQEWRGQIVEPPEVFDRIITLFTGHPSLIQGFIQFLPIGYRNALEKPPAPAPTLPPAQAQVVPYNFDPALEFVQMVKLRYPREIYDQFLDLLQPETLDLNESFVRVESMLVDQPDLLARFRNIMSNDAPSRSNLPPGRLRRS